MFAIGFDLVVEETFNAHPASVRQAYRKIERVLADFGFSRVQGSLFITSNDSLSNLFRAMNALKALAWLPPSVRDIRAFKVEHWSDFTPDMKA